MKKIIILLLAICTTISMSAKSFVFVDKSGNEIADGGTVSATEMEEDPFEGNMIPSGVSLKNISDDYVDYKFTVTVNSISNGAFQACFPDQCHVYQNPGTYNNGIGMMEPGQQSDIQSEWFPEEYGTCSVTFTATCTSSGDLTDVATVTVNFKYVDPSQESVIEWGYYNGDGSDLQGLGAGVTSYSVCMFVPGDKELKGGKIKGVKIPITDGSIVTSLSGWVANEIGTIPVSYAAEKTVTDLPAGIYVDENDVYAYAEFDTPIEIPASGCYVGYDFTITDATVAAGKYAILIDYYTNNLKGCYVLLNGAWNNLGSSYGVSGMLVSVSGLDMPEANATFVTIDNAVTAANTESEFEVTVTSTAGVPVSEIEYDIDIAGTKETRTAEVSIPAGISKTGTAKVKVKGPATAGNYDVKMNITKVNGKYNDQSTEVTTTTFANTSRLVERNTVMEENTGTGCQYCPRGMTGMEKLRKTFGDRFIGIALHQYNASDAMYFTNYRNIDFDGAPEALVDGKELMDPYYGTYTYSDNILGDIRKYSSIPAFADIKLSAKWVNEQVKVDAQVEGLAEGDYTIAYVLVADSLKGTGSGWAQQNYYYSRRSGSADIDSMWYKGGVYGTSPARPYFMDVAISSSYNASKKNQAENLGTLALNTPVNNSYTLSLPTSESLLAQVQEHINNVYAVAIVFDSKNQIAQAVRVKVDGEYEKPAALIDGDANCDEVVDVADITAIASYILGQTPAKFSEDNADANKDGAIDVADITATAGIILYDPTNGQNYVDLGLASGLLWAPANIGAAAPQEYGGYYAWGETETKTSYTKTNYFDASNTKYNTSSGLSQLDAADDIAAVTLGGSWRIPTDAEMTELRTSCTWTWVANYNSTGVSGMQVTGPNGNSIFLPAAGGMSSSKLSDAGTLGNYWTSSLSTSASKAMQIYFTEDGVTREGYNRYCGQSIRAVCPKK